MATKAEAIDLWNARATPEIDPALSQECMQNRDMVERVGLNIDAIYVAELGCGLTAHDRNVAALAALEASHHAELVEALHTAANRLKYLARCLSGPNDVAEWADEAAAVLAKTGGDA